MFLTQAFNKFLIAVALFASQMKVAMNSFHMIAQTQKHQQQADAVGPTAECHQISPVWLHQSLLLYKGPNLVQCAVHTLLRKL